MSLIRSIVERRSYTSGVPMSSSALPPPGAYFPTDSGKNVNADSAMRLNSVFGCVNLLTDLVAPLPWHAYRSTPTGQEVAVPDHPLLVNPSTEPSLSAADWRAQIMRSLLLRGNAWGLIKELGPFGEPVKIQMIHPDYVSVIRLGPLGPFEFRVLGQKHELWQAGGDLWHVPAYVVASTPVGLSPIDMMRQQIGLGLAAESYGAKWFGDSATPSGLLTTDQALTAEQAQTMKARWQESMNGSRSVGVVGGGVSFQPLSVSAEESQFIATQKLTATQIARIFGIPPEMIGAESGSSMTYSNVESRMLHLLILAGRPWIARLETALSNLLRSSVNVRANTDALLRTDARTRVDIQSQRLRMGVRSVNEIRAEDNLGPLPSDDGDRFLWPPFASKIDATEPITEPQTTDSTNA